MSGTRYEVRRHEYGRPGKDLPPKHRWRSVLATPDLSRAVVAAMEQDSHAVVVACSETVYDNGRPPACPRRWLPAQAERERRWEEEPS